MLNTIIIIKLKKKTYLNNDHFKKWMTSSNQNASTSNQFFLKITITTTHE